MPAVQGITQEARMTHRLSYPMLLPLLLITACGHAPTGVAGTAGGTVARAEAARSVAQAAAAARRDGADVVVKSEHGELRASATAVETEGSRLVAANADYTTTIRQVTALVDAACQVKDLIEQSRTENARQAALQFAATAGVKPAAVWNLAVELHDAKTSGARTRVVLSYALCEYAGSHS
jgi:hypothetical protein